MNAYLKPLPEHDPDSLPFWQGCRERRLCIQRCKGCGTHRYPPHRHCPNCRSAEAEWVTLGGRGKIYSWIVVRHPVPAEVYAGEVPYVVALIDLEEGVRMASNIVGCDPSRVHAGMPVEVVFEDVTPEVTLPKFRPVGGAG